MLVLIGIWYSQIDLISWVRRRYILDLQDIHLEVPGKINFALAVLRFLEVPYARVL